MGTKKLQTWQTKKLSEICNIFADGDWIEKKDQSSEGIRLIQTGNVGSGVFKNRKNKARYISEKTFDRLKCSEIFSPDCLVSRLPDPVGRACIIPDIGEKMITAVDCTIMRFLKEMILPQWFVYYSLSRKYQDKVDKQVSGATRQRISRKNLGLIEIPLPSLSEQKRIVSILDSVFEEIEKTKINAEKNLKNAREIFESYLQDVFECAGDGWVPKTLHEAAIYFGRGKSKHRPRNDKKLYGGDYPFIQTGDVRNSGHFITEHSQTYNDEGLAQSKLWPKNTLCITIAANIAETGILTFDSCFPDSIIGLVVDPKIAIVGFIEYLLQFHKGKLKDKGKGSAQDNINLATFKHESFLFPSIAEQKSIVTKLDVLSKQTKKLEEIYKQKLVALNELKQSILRKAFNGELLITSIGTK